MKESADNLVALARTFFDSHSAFVPEALAQRALEDQPQHVEANLLYAETQAKLGRTERALEWFEKTINLAPNHVNARERYDSYHAQLQDDMGRRPFDFLVVPPGRAGYLALEMMLALHPNVQPVPSWRFERAMADGVEHRLAGEFAPLRRTMPNLVMGFIKHICVAGLDAPEDVAARTAAIVDNRMFIEMVREPLATVRSMVNHYACRRTFDGIYTNLGLAWPNGCRWNGRSWEWNRPSEGELNSFDKPNPEAMFSKALPGLRYHHIGKLYAAHFDTWEVVDSSEISPVGAAEGMPRLLELIGADPTFHHPHFGLLHNAQPQRWMRMNVATLDVGGPLKVRLGYRFEGLMQGTGMWLEMAKTPCTEDMKVVGLQDIPHVLLVDASDWAKLPDKICCSLETSEAFQRLLDDILLPIWLENYHRAAAWLAPLLIDEVPAKYQADLREYLGNDTELLLKAHPHLERKWYP